MNIHQNSICFNKSRLQLFSEFPTLSYFARSTCGALRILLNALLREFSCDADIPLKSGGTTGLLFTAAAGGAAGAALGLLANLFADLTTPPVALDIDCRRLAPNANPTADANIPAPIIKRTVSDTGS